MTGEPTTTLIGNLTADPELRFTPSGSAVANFTVAITPRTFDRQSNEWKDGETLFMRCSAWREMAENVAQTLAKGMRVIAEGRLKSRSYETKEGEKRTVIEAEIEEIGPSLRYATAQVQRTQNNGQGGQQAQQGGYQAGGFGNQEGNFGGQQQGGGFGGGFPGQQQPAAQQGGGFGGWNQTAAQQQVTAQAQQGGQQQSAQQYAQAAANGPQNGGQQPYVQAPQQDPWATPGVSNNGGWGTGPGSEPPF